jgi:DNA-binding NarL/FixJ family response regulator
VVEPERRRAMESRDDILAVADSSWLGGLALDTAARWGEPESERAVATLVIDYEALGHHRLSEREMDVVHGILHGMTNTEIAARLVVADETIKSHVRKILDKLEATSRSHIPLKLIEAGVLKTRVL